MAAARHRSGDRHPSGDPPARRGTEQVVALALALGEEWDRFHQGQTTREHREVSGAVNVLGRAPSRRDFLDATRHLAIELDELGVDVRLGREVDPDAITRSGGNGSVEIVARTSRTADPPFTADVVVLATGAVPLRPDVPGVDTAAVIGVAEALEGTADVGQRVVIVDQTGTFAAVSVAQMLAGTGRTVTVVAAALESAAALGPPDRQIQLAALFADGVELIPAHRLVEIDLPAVRFAHALDGSPLELATDTVVLSTGATSDGAAFAGLDGVVEHLHRVGDCVAPRDVGMAIYTAEELGRAL